MREIIIGKNQCGQRLDKFLAKYLKEAPKSFLYKMLRKKNIKRNGKRAEGNEKLEEGDVITLYLAEETIVRFTGQEPQETKKVSKSGAPEIDVLYENEHIVLINKPAGLLSQKANAGDDSLNDRFVRYVGETEAGFTPGICNRLDRNTSGIVIAGKSLAGLQKMSELIRDRKIQKYYLAVVKGVMDKKEVVCGYLKKDAKTNQVRITEGELPGSSYIRTGYEPLCSDGSHTLLRVQLFTGKPHQIRSHLSSLGHPIVGDLKYGGSVWGIEGGRQLLHAYEVVFPEMEGMFADLSGKNFQAEVPADFCREGFVKKLLENGLC